MAVEREHSVIHEEIIIRAEFLWTSPDGDEQHYDPVGFEDVEILDEQNNVIQIIPAASIVRDDTGLYHAIAGPFDETLVLFDRWIYDNLNTLTQYLHPGSIDVRWTDEDGHGYVMTESSQVYINVFRQEILDVMTGLAVYIYKNNEPDYDFVWAGVTDAWGRVNPVLEKGEYRIVLALNGYVFNWNVFPMYVEHPVTRRYVYTDAFPAEDPVVNRVPSDQICLVKFYFGKLDGTPLSNVRIIVDASGVTTVTGTLSETIILSYGPLEDRTNAFGYAELPIIRGAEIDVYVEGTNFQRHVIIPDQDEVNFGDLAGVYDPLTALVLVPPEADVDIP